MKLSVNGKTVELERPMTVAEYLEARGLKYTLLSVQYNQEPTVRADWRYIVLKDYDRLEITRVVAGG